ncbi:YnbE family lipoprotein [Thalassomonas haliotis]|nr:YnbE family lipoprotein [Thalassomonas haliotis]
MKMKLSALIIALLLFGCTPTVQVAADKPVTINLNVKIEHEIRIKVDKELDKIINDDELF